MNYGRQINSITRRRQSRNVFSIRKISISLILYVLQQADNFTNSLGILQQSAVPSQFPGFGNKTPQQQPPPSEDHTHLFAQLIARTAKDIEVLIDSLPNEESSIELQSASLQKLEEENLEAANKLEEVVKQGEATLKEIQAALHDIAQAQLEMQKLESVEL